VSSSASSAASTFLVIGERTNITGSPKFSKALKAGDWDACLAIARQQVESGANILDINVDEALIDGEATMVKFLNLIAAEPEISRVPIMVDSSKWSVLEKGLQCLQGKGMHWSPASRTDHFDESSITGTREISGSAAMRLRNFTIVASPSMSASSTLMSMMFAPDSTCWRAIARHASQSPAFSAFANFGEPVIFVRSPTMRKVEALRVIGTKAPNSCIHAPVESVNEGRTSAAGGRCLAAAAHSFEHRRQPILGVDEFHRRHLLVGVEVDDR
jgi:hypothetical protein